MSVIPSAPEALAAAVIADDAATVRAVLQRFPELKTRLDDEMPGGGFGATALLTAVGNGNREMIDVLLEAGANINQRSHWWAGSFGVLDHDGDLADFLIERGATIDVHAASRLGRLDILDALISADPPLVHARGGDGQTPLHCASSVPIAEYLLAQGADIDARDVDHESTPVQWMVRDRQDVARFLVSHGCKTDILLASALGDRHRVARQLDDDPSAIRIVVSDEFFPKQDSRSAGSIYNWTLGSGKGPHVIAREFAHAEVFRLLMERSPLEVQLAVWAALGDRGEVEAVLARDRSVAARLGPAEHRKLPDAARDENLAAVRVMLSAGWPVDTVGQHGATALHWAAFHGHLGLTRELLLHGPPLEAVDQDHNGTPLQWAIYGSVHGWRCGTGDYAGVVEALLDAGATRPERVDDKQGSAAVRQALSRWIDLGGR